MKKKTSKLKQILAWTGFAIVTTGTALVALGLFIAAKENSAFLDGVEAHANQDN